jgi:hypothetical protein
MVEVQVVTDREDPQLGPVLLVPRDRDAIRGTVRGAVGRRGRSGGVAVGTTAASRAGTCMTQASRVAGTSRTSTRIRATRAGHRNGAAIRTAAIGSAAGDPAAEAGSPGAAAGTSSPALIAAPAARS